LGKKLCWVVNAAFFYYILLFTFLNMINRFDFSSFKESSAFHQNKKASNQRENSFNTANRLLIPSLRNKK